MIAAVGALLAGLALGWALGAAYGVRLLKGNVKHILRTEPRIPMKLRERVWARVSGQPLEWIGGQLDQEES